ncbi:MAG TPA: hypothetical protein VK550_21560 [Polyangiaceae bacterium]|nr:hypothetical protein [Polyangiaceae bacterium]
MLTVLSSIGVAIAGGAVGAAIVVFLLFAIRTAIMAAFAATAARELEMMRARYSETLEEKRQQFVRELERERQHAARSLELLKSELGDRAEMRRQVIAKRLTALEEIAGAGEPVVRALSVAPPMRDGAARVSALSHLTAVMRQNSHLLPADLQRHLFSSVTQIDGALEKSKQANAPDGLLEARRASEAFLKRVRSELLVEEVEEMSEATPPRGVM